MRERPVRRRWACHVTGRCRVAADRRRRARSNNDRLSKCSHSASLRHHFKGSASAPSFDDHPPQLDSIAPSTVPSFQRTAVPRSRRRVPCRYATRLGSWGAGPAETCVPPCFVCNRCSRSRTRSLLPASFGRQRAVIERNHVRRPQRSRTHRIALRAVVTLPARYATIALYAARHPL